MFKYKGKKSASYSRVFHVRQDCQAIITPTLTLQFSVAITVKRRSPNPWGVRPFPPPKVKLPKGGLLTQHSVPAVAPEMAEPGIALTQAEH